MSEGWFRVSRNLTDARHDLHPQSSDEPACRLGAWVDLIGYARWDDGGGLERGQLRAGVRFLAARWNWSKSRVSRFLCSLEDAGRISRGTQSGTRAGRVPDIITICNYETYQAEEPNCGTQAGRRAGLERDANEDKEEEVQEEAPPIVPPMWAAWKDEMWESDTRRTLTPKRRQKLTALYHEHLARDEDPVWMTRRIAQIILADDWWGPREDTHVPETALRNKERREKWVARARKEPKKLIGLDAPLHRLQAS